MPWKYLEPDPSDDLSPVKVKKDDLDDGQPWEYDGHCGLAATRRGSNQEAWTAAVQAYLTSMTFVDHHFGHHLGRPIEALDRSAHVARTGTVPWIDGGLDIHIVGEDDARIFDHGRPRMDRPGAASRWGRQPVGCRSDAGRLA